MSIFLFFLIGCTTLEEAHKQKVKEINQVKELIQRKEGETVLTILPPRVRVHRLYPWEEQYIGSIRKITKEFFRCKGSSSNPAEIVKGKEPVYFYDCTPHSLPIREGEERVSTLLIDMLNFVQQKLEARVVITSAHQCPTHQKYLRKEKKSKMSRYLVGAKVDFYVEGYERKPQEVAALLNAFFKEPLTVQVKGQEWSNREVRLVLRKSGERRNWDNRHPYPYFSLEDRTFTYTWDQAHKGLIIY
ncbi:MAG: hypothetical protein KBC64_08115 [Simkaniaceae bacterium]|nr:hypothetical protein [Simkaniaceae bacterium]